MDGNQNQKKDAGKPQMSLLSFTGLKLVVRVLEFGIWKYGKRDGWKDVDDGVKRYTDALQRHVGDLCEYGLGHLDAESGLPTVGHLGCDAMFLCYFYALEHGDPGRPWLAPADDKGEVIF